MHCIGCGTPTDHSASRTIPVSKFKEFVRRRCSPSRFHYKVVAELPEAGDAKICLHCVSWRKRCARGGHRHGSYTPMDSVLLYVLEPGAVPMQDHRYSTRCHTKRKKILKVEKTTGASSASCASYRTRTICLQGWSLRPPGASWAQLAQTRVRARSSRAGGRKMGTLPSSA